MSDILKNYWVHHTIKDESILEEVELQNPGRLTAIQPIFSYKGPSNRIIEYNSLNKIRSTYGHDYDNVEKYGQSGLLCSQSIKGGANTYICRLMPDNAVTSRLIFGIAISEKAEVVVYERAADEGSFTLDSSGNKQAKANKEAGVEFAPIKYLESDITGNVDGSADVSATWSYTVKNKAGTDIVYTVYPLFRLESKYSGLCGNDFAFNIVKDTERDGNVKDGRRYIMNLLEKDSFGNYNGVIADSEIYFSFNPEAVFSEGSTVSESLEIGYEELGKENPITGTIYNANYKALTDVLNKYKRSYDTNAIDFIFGKNVKGFDYDLILQNTEMNKEMGAIYADVSTSKINSLLGGSDGSLQLGLQLPVVGGGITTVTQQSIVTTKNQLLEDFYSYKIDTTLIDDRIVDCGVTYDANFAVSVKKVMLSTFREHRTDVMVFVDCGITTRQSDADKVAKDLKNSIDVKSGQTAVIVVSSGVATDINKPYKLTATYEIARSLPESWNANGTYSVYAGYKAGVIKYMEFNWLPSKNTTNSEIAPLKEAQLFFPMKLNKRGRIAWMNESTQYGVYNSKLRSIRNGLVIGRSQREASAILIKYVFDNNGIETVISAASQELDRRFSSIFPKNVKVETNLYQSKRDKRTENATCELIIYFPNIPEGFKVIIKARREGVN